MLRTLIAAALFLCFTLPAHAFNLGSIPGPLLAKVQELKAACGAVVVSAHRAGARTPSGHVSNHALGKAVDLRGNARCMYARLKGWRGGMSTDYHGAPGGPHIHLSYNPGGMEWGLKFSHRRGSYAYSAARKKSKRWWRRR